jgi:hypothetical protein
MGLRRSLPNLICLVAVAVATTACAEVGQPDLGVVPTSTTSTTVASQAAADAADTPAPSAPFVAQLTPARPADFSPQVLVADDEGVRVLGGERLVGDLVVDRVLDDPTGGLVLELADAEQRTIAWLPAGDDAPQVIAQGGQRLMDAGLIDGSVHVVVAEGSEVRLIRLGEPEEVLLAAVDPEDTIVSVAAAAGLYAVVVRDDACGTLELWGSDGARVDVGGIELPACETPGRSTFGLVAFSPEGETFAYTERSFRSDSAVARTEVVVQDLQGTELHRSTIGEDGQRIVSLSLDRQRIAVLRDAESGPEVVQVDYRQASDVSVTVVPSARFAAFNRVPLVAPTTTTTIG